MLWYAGYRLVTANLKSPAQVSVRSLRQVQPVLAATQLRFHEVQQSPELLQCLRDCLSRLGRQVDEPIDCRVVLEPDRVFIEIRRRGVQLSVARVVEHTLLEALQDAFEGLQRALTSDVPWPGGYRTEPGVTDS